MSVTLIPEIEKYPAKISKPYLEYAGSRDPRAVHKSLLDLGEGLLDYLVAFMFGEYKRSGNIDESLEAEFYKNTGRNISAGVKAGFLRRLTKNHKDSVIAKKIHTGTSFERAGYFAQTYDLLKQITGEGDDSGFAEKLESLRKGRTAKKLGLNDFYNYFIQIRNIFAHPENKAGPKSSPRDWPLNEDYFAVINDELHQALVEIIVDFEIVKSFTPVFVNSIDSSQKNAIVEIQRSDKPSNQTIDLSQDDLEEIMSEEHYVLNETDAIYAKLYLSKIPPLNSKIAEKVIRNEKSKIEEPRLKESIDHMLDDNAIDYLEYFALKDSATRAFISEDRLKELIIERKNKKGIDKPLEDILVETKVVETRAMFNPWWLEYFGLLDIIDGKKVIEQRKESKSNKGKITELEDKKKGLRIKKKIDKIELELGEKEKQLKNCKDEENKQQIDSEISQLNNILQELEPEKNKRFADLDKKIENIEIQEDTSMRTSQWTMHKLIWGELTSYFQGLFDESLNADILTNEDGESSEGRWIVNPNKWQIGALTHYYEGRVYKEGSILGDAVYLSLNVNKGSYKAGVAYTKAGNTSKHLVTSVLSPSVQIFCMHNWKLLPSIDVDNLLIKKYVSLLEDLRDENVEDFIKLGAVFYTEDAIHQMGDYELLREKISTWKLSRPEFIADDIQHKDIWKMSSIEHNSISEKISSQNWTIDDCMEGNNISSDCVMSIERSIIAYINVFSNVISDLNDYALSIGINEEYIRKSEQRTARGKEVLLGEAKKYLVNGILELGAEGNKRFREIASEHGISETLLNTSILPPIRDKVERKP